MPSNGRTDEMYADCRSVGSKVWIVGVCCDEEEVDLIALKIEEFVSILSSGSVDSVITNADGSNVSNSDNNR